jgi:hypothetical protein
MTPNRLARELEARLNGPHAEEHTTGTADLISEGVRFLNYATGSGAGDALEYPAAIYQVLGSLSEAAYRWLVQQDAAGMLAMDDHTSPADALAESAVCLEEASTMARQLGEELATAQSRISRLNGRGPNRQMEAE